MTYTFANFLWLLFYGWLLIFIFNLVIANVIALFSGFHKRKKLSVTFQDPL